MMAEWGPAEFLINKCSDDRRGVAEDRSTVVLDPPLLTQGWGVKEHLTSTSN